MSYTMKEFACVDLHREIDVVKCAKCGCELQEYVADYYCSADGRCCVDCCFEELSEISEKYSVGVPFVSRLK